VDVPVETPALLRVELSEPDIVFADEVSGWLYDTILLHDALVLCGPDYDYQFNQFFYRRNGRPVRREHRLRLVRLTYESPMVIETLVLTAVAARGLLRTYEWLRDRPERRRIVRAEADKTEEEARKARIDRKRAQIELDRMRREERFETRIEPRPQLLEAVPELANNPEARAIAEREAGRLAANPLEVTDVQVEHRR
jgi:hypothetical protein